jgi:hypothetical protein
MNRSTRTAAFVLALSLFIMSGCGDKKEKDTRSEESTTAAESIAKEYAPTEEIKNAKLSSGLIQIGDYVFKNGGYYTVGQFVEEYGDKFEHIGGKLDLDGALVGDEEEFAVFKPKEVPLSGNLPLYAISIIYSNLKAEEGHETPLKDAIIYEIGAEMVDYDEFDSIWQPGGIKAFPNTIEQSEIVSCFEGSGLKKSDSKKLFSEFHGKKEYDVYTLNDSYQFKEDGAASCYVRGDEKNLYGVYPIFYYRFAYMEGSTTAKSFQHDRDFAEYTDTDDWKKYEG